MTGRFYARQDELHGVGKFFTGFGVGLTVVAGVLDGAGLEAVGATEAPVGDGDALDEDDFGAVLGFVGTVEGGEEVLEVGGVFVGVVFEEDVSGEEAVTEGVLG